MRGEDELVLLQRSSTVLIDLSPPLISRVVWELCRIVVEELQKSHSCITRWKMRRFPPDPCCRPSLHGTGFQPRSANQRRAPCSATGTRGSPHAQARFSLFVFFVPGSTLAIAEILSTSDLTLCLFSGEPLILLNKYAERFGWPPTHYVRAYHSFNDLVFVTGSNDIFYRWNILLKLSTLLKQKCCGSEQWEWASG